MEAGLQRQVRRLQESLPASMSCVDAASNCWLAAFSLQLRSCLLSGCCSAIKQVLLHSLDAAAACRSECAYVSLRPWKQPKCVLLCGCSDSAWSAQVSHIQQNTKIPVMGHADGICHIYVDEVPQHLPLSFHCLFAMLWPDSWSTVAAAVQHMRLPPSCPHADSMCELACKQPTRTCKSAVGMHASH